MDKIELSTGFIWLLFVVDWNSTVPKMHEWESPKSKEMDINSQLIHERLKEQRSDDTAVLDEFSSLSFAQLNQKSEQFANYLRHLGIKQGDKIGLCLDRCVELLVIMLGVLKAGATFVPLDPSHPKLRILSILNEIKPFGVVIHPDYQSQFDEMDVNLIYFSEDNIASVEAQFEPPQLTSKELAYIIFTSGTTGKPKGVLIAHASVVNYAQWFSSFVGIKSGQRIEWTCNYIFDMAITTSIVATMLGLVVVIGSDDIKKDIRRYLEFIQQKKINIIKITPSYFKAMIYEINRHPIDLPDLKTLILGGEALRAKDCQAWLKYYPEHVLINEYGPTEATVAVSQFTINKDNCHLLINTFVPIGMPCINTRLHILDARNKPVPDGEEGELHIGGVCLAQGYLNQKKLTQSRFIKDFFSPDVDARLYKTGDLCRRLSDGSIDCLGRMDRQVKIRGYRIELHEIEWRLTQHPALYDAAVIVKSIACDDDQLIAYYIPRDTNLTPNQLRQYLSCQVPEYMVPGIFIGLDAFPLAKNGKLNYAALPDPVSLSRESFIAPKTPLQDLVTTIWTKELGLESIGIEDNFFELGGHSLTAARILSQINHVLGKNITLNEFYQANNIDNLVSLINKTQTSSKFYVLEKKQRDSKKIPLSDFQLLMWLSILFEPKARKLNIVSRKRLQGPLELHALKMAFEQLLKQHQIFHYKIAKFYPAQSYQKNLKFDLFEMDLQSRSKIDYETHLALSMNELIYFYDWKNTNPLIVARLFYLESDVSELQICLPHLVSDAVSMDIILADLSKFYLSFKHQLNIESVDHVLSFKDYIKDELHFIHEHQTLCQEFWSNYLNDAGLFVFPKQYITQKTSNFSYSTYLEISEQAMNHLRQFCAQNQVNLNDALCAALSMALAHCCNIQDVKPNKILMNIIRSTRDNHLYDGTVGCFIRVDPIKVDLMESSSWSSLAKQVNHEVIDSAPYQQCSNMVKFASINKRYYKRNIISRYFIMLGVIAYSKLLFFLKLKYKALSLCWRLASIDRKSTFIININVWTNFLSSRSQPSDHLFGLKLNKTPNYSYDLSTMDNILDVCFLRDDADNKPWLVISGNLKPEFREQIAKKMIDIILQEPASSLITKSVRSLVNRKAASLAASTPP